MWTDGICDGQEVAGYTDESADNYNPDAGLSDGSCEHSLSGWFSANASLETIQVKVQGPVSWLTTGIGMR